MGPLPASTGCDCQVCRPETSYDAADRRSIDTVLQHGWQVLMVSDECDCSHEGEHSHAQAGPDFAYTVGLGHRCGHPELLISGLDPTVMHHVLNDVAQRVMDGRGLKPGDVLEGVLLGVPVVVEAVNAEASRGTVTWSGWFHRRRPEALAIVWPSTHGVFPWQPGAPAALNERQPPAWRVPHEHTGGVACDPQWVFPVPADRMAFTCTHVIDEGAAVLWVAREADPSRGEDWSIHCGAPGHDTGDMRLAHLSHLVRSAPSLIAVSDMGLDEEAYRESPEAEWVVRPLT
nr:DUF4262 domain-containing protein [Knoellia subterranea]